MPKLTDRRKSPLAAVHPAAPASVHPTASAAAIAEQAPSSEPTESPKPAAPVSRPTAVKSAPARPAAAARGRGPQAGKVSALDMVSFNCNLTRDARAKAKMYAASIDVALQDVVEAALIAYLEPRGFEIERRPDAPELP